MDALGQIQVARSLIVLSLETGLVAARGWGGAMRTGEIAAQPSAGGTDRARRAGAIKGASRRWACKHAAFRHLPRRSHHSPARGAPRPRPGATLELSDPCAGLWAHTPGREPVPTGACTSKGVAAGKLAHSSDANLVHSGDVDIPAAFYFLVTSVFLCGASGDRIDGTFVNRQI